MSQPTQLSLVVTQTNRLPQAVLAVVLRTEKVTFTKMSTSRWLIDIPQLSRETLLELLNVLNLDGIEVHETNN